MTSEPTRILVPVDFSAESARAVDYAVALAAKLAASVELVHVVEDPIASGAWGAQAYVLNVAWLIAELEEDARRRLASIEAEYATRGVPISTRVVSGSAARTIVAIAEGERCGLIVMGTHGHSGVSHLLLGSVAERVVRTAPCPVLTMRAEKQQAISPEPTAVHTVA